MLSHWFQPCWCQTCQYEIFFMKSKYRDPLMHVQKSRWCDHVDFKSADVKLANMRNFHATNSVDSWTCSKTYIHNTSVQFVLCTDKLPYIWEVVHQVRWNMYSGDMYSILSVHKWNVQSTICTAVMCTVYYMNIGNVYSLYVISGGYLYTSNADIGYLYSRCTIWTSVICTAWNEYDIALSLSP